MLQQQQQQHIRSLEHLIGGGEEEEEEEEEEVPSTNSDSDPFEYDMSNRAQLPKGIENIRPHLETMDNVPLLVSLFTDSTPDTTREMISIMQVRRTALKNVVPTRQQRIRLFHKKI